MKTFAIIAAALVGFGSNIALEPSSKVWVNGNSTVRAFTCNAKQITSSLQRTETTDIADLVTSAQVTIPVAKLDCGNGTMNEHMQKALKLSQNPNIEFKLNS